MPQPAHLVIVKHGELRNSYYRIKEHDRETFHFEKYVLEFYQELAEHCPVTVVSVNSTPHDEVLAPGLRSVGVDLRKQWKVEMKKLVGKLSELSPTHMLVRNPLPQVIRFAINNNIRTLPFLADSFEKTAWREKIKYYRLARLLNSSKLEYVANHCVPACHSLSNIGVKAHKIVPWDFPPFPPVSDYTPKQLTQNSQKRLFFAGSIVEAKGILECIEAVGLLNQQGLDVTLTIAGKGRAQERCKQLAEALNLSQKVTFLGQVKHDEVIQFMRSHDAVFVPTRWEYSESGPMTLRETLLARTPIVASDHPIIRAQLQDGKNCLMFETGNPEQIAQKVQSLLTDPMLYQRLSENSETTLQRLNHPVRITEVISRWFHNTPADQAWLSSCTLDKFPAASH